MRNYINVIDDLTEVLNFKSTNEVKAQANKQRFNMCLTELKDDFKTDVSTKFLMGFVIGDEKQKSNRVNYLLSSIGLNAREKITDCFFESYPSLTIKANNDITLYSSKIDNQKNEKIYFKTIQMTSHDLKGVCRPCKVGVYSCKLKTVSLNQIKL
jgi:hypothetical protein